MALRWLTAGESHGEALVGIIEGVPAGVELTSDMVRDALARSRGGDEPRCPHEVRGGPRAHPGRCASWPDSGRPGRD